MKKTNGKKTLRVIVLMVAAVLLASACFLIVRDVFSYTGLQDYHVRDLTVSLPEGFAEYVQDEFDYEIVWSKDEANYSIAVLAWRQSFDQQSNFASNFSEYTPEQFARRNTLTGVHELKMNREIPYVEYEKNGHYYMACVYKASDAFWIISFCAPATERDTYHSQFLKWARTVRLEK